MANILRKTFDTEMKANDKDRSLIVTISTSTPDRSRDIVEPSGAVLDNFKRNPVIALGHNYSGLSIAKAPEIQIIENKIVAKATFPPVGVYGLADTAYTMAKEGFMNGWSIGFMPLEWEELESGGRRYTKWELLEFSLVLVPDNPEAVTLLRSAGMDDKSIEKVQHFDSEADAEEVKKEIAAVSKATKDVEKKEESVETLEKTIAELKEGRILSGATRKQINNAVTQLEDASTALKNLLELTQKEDPQDPEPNKSAVTLDNPPQLVPVVRALKQVDKVVGIALRDYNANEKEN